jgi:hypothetical protein
MEIFVDARFVPDAQYEEHLEAEKRHVQMLRDSGLIVGLYRRLDGTGAFLMCRTDSVEGARSELEELPFVRLGLMKLELWPIETL